MATAAATWTDSARREPGWLITGRQDHPNRLSHAIPG